MKKNNGKKKAGIIASSVVAVGLLAGGVTVGVLSATSKVTIKFDTNGANNFNDATIKKGGVVELPIPMRAGYKFLGWYLDADKTIAVNEKTKFNKDTVLYAKWEESVYTINFEDTLGIGDNMQSSLARYNSLVRIRDLEDQSGLFTFVGWSEKPNGERIGEKIEGYTEWQMPLYGSTLYALWEGRDVELQIVGSESQTLKVKDEVYLPVPTVKPTNGYIDGFVVENKGERKVYNVGDKIEIDPNFVVEEGGKLIYRLAYNIKTTNNRVIKYVEYDGTFDEQNAGTTLKEASDIPGHEFVGWYKSKEFKEEDKVTDISEIQDLLEVGTVVLYAKRESEKVTIKFNYGGATPLDKNNLGILEFEANVGEKVWLPHAREYAKTNIDFIGWKDNDTLVAGGNFYTVTRTGVIELEASWGSAFNMLYFNLNGGSSNEVNNVDYRVEGQVTLPTWIPEKLGYTFEGWSESKTGSADYAPGATFELKRRQVLYAVWSAKSYNIEYDLGIGIKDGGKAQFGNSINVENVTAAETKTGYKLAGWEITYLQGGHTGVLQVGRELKIGENVVNKDTTNITLKAIWESKSYSVRIGGITEATKNAVSIVDENGNVSNYNSISGANVKFNSKIKINTNLITPREHYDIIGAVLFNLFGEAQFSEVNPVDGAWGDENTRIQKNEDGIIEITLNNTELGQSQEGSSVGFELNLMPHKIDIVYDANGGTLKDDVNREQVYYGIKKDYTQNSVDYTNVLSELPENKYFSHWEVEASTGRFQFEGAGVKIGRVDDYNRSIYGNNSINELVLGNNEIVLKAIYVDPIYATLSFSAESGYWDTNVDLKTFNVDITKTGDEDVVKTFTLTPNQNGEIVINGETLASPTRAGYKFLGYTLEEDVESELIITNSNNEPQSFRIKALWEAKSYNVTLINHYNGVDQQVYNLEESNKITVGKSFDATLNTLGNGNFSRTGYTLIGYARSAAANTYETSITLTGSDVEGLLDTDNFKLYAIWQEYQNRTIVFEPNKGKGSTDVTLKYDSTSFEVVNTAITISKNVAGALGDINVPLPILQRRDGYTFKRWNTSADGTGDTYTSISLNASSPDSLTLYAIWEANTYIVNYVINSSKGEELLNPSSSTRGEIVFDEEGLLLDLQLKDKQDVDDLGNKYFIGWALSANLSGEEDVVSKLALNRNNFNLVKNKDDISIYPVFAAPVEKTLVVNFGGQDQGVVITNQQVITGLFTREVRKQPAVLNIAEILAILNDPTRGYIVKTGHRIKAIKDAQGNVLSQVTLNWKTDDSLLVANAEWEPITYQLTFDKNYTTSDQTISVDSKFNLSTPLLELMPQSFYNSLTRENYQLLGWDKNKDATFPGYANDSWTYFQHYEAEDVTLYAIWKECFVTLAFDIGEADGEAPQNVILPLYSGDTVSISGQPNSYQVWETSKAFSRDGYNFGGWSYTLNGEYGEVLVGQTLSSEFLMNLVTDNPQNVPLVLTAIWELQDTALFNASGVYTGGNRKSLHIPSGIDLATANIDADIEYITLPFDLTNLPANAIRSKTLKKLVLGGKITHIEAGAIASSSLKFFAVDKDVVTLGGNPVIQYNNVSGVLSEFVVDDRNLSYKTINGCILNKSQNILYAVPQTFVGDGSGTFELNNLEEFTQVNEIYKHAFNGARYIRRLVFSPGTRFEDRCLEFMPQLVELYFGVACVANNPGIIGEGITNLTTIFASSEDNLSEGGIYYNDNIGLYVSLLDNSSYLEKAVPNKNFEKNGLNLSGNQFVGAYALEGCNVKNVVIGENTQYDGDPLACLSYIKNTLTTVVVHGEGLKPNMFKNFTNLTNVDLSSGITYIVPEGCFENCYNLKNLITPNNFYFKEIGAFAFKGNPIKSFTFSGEEKIDSRAFENVVFDEVSLNYDTGSSVDFSYITQSEIPILNITDRLKNGILVENNVFKKAKYVNLNYINIIGDKCFYQCTNLEEIDMSNVDEVGIGAFQDCTNLYTFTLNVDQGGAIEDFAFAGCEKLDISIIRVATIGTQAFLNCNSLQSITFTAVQSIGEKAFASCANLKDILIYEDIHNFGASAFAGCSNLEAVYFNKPTPVIIGNVANSFYTTLFAGCSPNLSFIFPNNEACSRWASSPWGAYSNRFISATTGNVNVGTYQGGTYRLNITNRTATLIGVTESSSIEIPEQVTINGVNYTVANIEANAFNGNLYLRRVTINTQNIHQLTEGLFANCTNLTDVVIDCGGLGGYALPSMFENCVNLKNVTLSRSEGIVAIDKYAFRGCTSLTSITIPSGAKIETEAFSGCSSLKKVIFEGGAENWNGEAIGDEAFKNCTSLTSFVMPRKLNRLGLAAFSGCSNLETVDFSSVEGLGVIENSTFENCFKLKNLVSFYDCNIGQEGIGEKAFKGCISLTEFKVRTVELGSYAFAACVSLESVSIEGIKVVPEYAFYECSNLTNITWADSYVESIGTLAFHSCKKLENIDLSSLANLKTINANAFAGINNIKSLTLPNGLQTIDNQAFGTLSVEKIIVPASVTSLGSNVFVWDSNVLKPKQIVMEGAPPTTVADNPFCSANQKDIKFGLQVVVPSAYETEYKNNNKFNGYTIVTTATNDFNELNEGTVKLHYTFNETDKTAEIAAAELVGAIYPTTYVVPSSVMHNGESYTITSIAQGGFNNAKGYGVGPLDYVENLTIPETITKVGGLIAEYNGLKNLTNVTFLGDYPRNSSGSSYMFSSPGSMNRKINMQIKFIGEYYDKWSQYGINTFVSGSLSYATVKVVREFTTIAMEDESFRYIIDVENKTATLTGCLSNKLDYIIPESVTYEGMDYTVNEIIKSAFPSSTDVRSIVIPGTVKTIGEQAFLHNSTLTSVTILDGVEIIGKRAFYSCSKLTEVTIPSTVVEIGREAFGQCSNLQKVKLNEGLKTIGDMAFYYGSYSQIEIPSSVVEIGYSAFNSKNTLTFVQIKGEKPEVVGTSPFGGLNTLQIVVDQKYLQQYKNDVNLANYNLITNINDVVFDEIKEEIVDGIVYEVNYTTKTAKVVGCKEDVVDVLIPGTILKGINVVSIGIAAFKQNVNIKTVEISDGVTEINSSAFYGCYSLTSVKIPSSVKKISSSAFSYCFTLRDVQLSEGLERIEDNAFSYSYSLMSITIPSTVNYLGENVIYFSAVRTVFMLGDVPNFYRHSSMGYRSPFNFGNVAPTHDKNNIKIYVPLVYYSNYTKSGTDYGHNWGSYLIRYTTPIDTRSYNIISGSKTSFEDSSDKFILNNWIYTLNEAAYTVDIVGYNKTDAPTHIQFPDFMLINNKLYVVNAIGNNETFTPVFSSIDSSLIQSVELPKFLKFINNGAFEKTYLTSINLPETLNYIGERAFGGCTNLTSIKFPAALKNIGPKAFYGCLLLSNIYFNEGLEKIGDNAFEDCGELTMLNLPSTVVSIGYGAFANCLKVSQVVMPQNLVDLGDDVFLHLENLTLVTFTCAVPPRALNGNLSTLFEYANKEKLLIYVPVGSEEAYKNLFYNWQELIVSKNSVIEYSDGTYIYKINLANYTAELSKYIGLETEVDLPSTIQFKGSNYSIKTIGENAFSESSVVSVTIPEGITKIDESAFGFVSSLTSVVLPNSLTHISKNAFNSTALTNLTIPSGVTFIGKSAFSYLSNLSQVTFNEGLEEIGILAFDGCGNLTSIEIPSSVKKIGYNAFGSCYNLSTLTLREGLTSIGNGAFYGSKITSLYLPSTLSFVGFDAFRDCKQLTNVEISSGLTEISDTMFFGCSKLTNLTLPNSITKIGVSAFEQCTSLSSVTLSENLTEISAFAFQTCNQLDSITIPENVSIIGASAFTNCVKLRDVVFNNNIQIIGEKAFKNCRSLVNVTLPQSVTNIDSEAFAGCLNLMNFELLATNPPVLGLGAFNLVSNDFQIKVPESNVLDYEEADVWRAFRGKIVSAFTKIIYVDDLGFSYVLDISQKTATLNSVDLSITEADLNTVDYNGEEYTIVGIGSNAFRNASNLTSLSLSENITSIGANAFENCTKLTNIEIPSKVREINAYTFKNCSSLTTLTIPETVLKLHDNAFANSGLTSIVIPNTVLQIGSGLFYGCANLQSVTLPSNLTTIYNYMFFNCENLTNVNIPENVTKLESQCFYNCKKLASIELKQGLTEIGNNAFTGCASLNNVVIPQSVTVLESGAFSNCESLSRATILGNVVGASSQVGIFSSVASDFVLYVPSECLEAYKSYSGFSEIINQIMPIED